MIDFIFSWSQKNGPQSVEFREMVPALAESWLMPSEGTEAIEAIYTRFVNLKWHVCETDTL